MTGQTVSHYKILEKLGEGGMGAVYLAEDLSLGRKVAVKFLSSDQAADPEARKRFVHEARAQALVSHTNITSFHEVGEERDKVFIVMEYIEGQPLSELAKTEKLLLPEILDLAIQIGEGLSAAHERGVMHRDINPANILVTSKRAVKITDFGLAKWKGASTITGTGLQMGTDSYMSPEQLEGRKADFRTDIFSFGVVLYELICARRPFEGNNRETLFYEILYSQPHPLARYCRGIPESLERLVMKCLAKKPEERYQSVADLVADLKREKKSMESGQRILPKTKKWLPFLVPAGIGLIVLLFLVFKPFSIEIGTDKETAADENSLAVMYFENIPDPEDKDHTGEMLTNLLITSLSQTSGLEVISRQRLYDIQQEMGSSETKKITPSLASKIAQRAGVRTMLLGTVLQSQPKLAVTSQLIEVKSGKILNSQRLAEFSAERLFPFVDSLANLVRNDLKITPSPATETKSVAEVTTTSPEAYRSYLEGVEQMKKFYFSEAQAAFRRAIELDSNFAMAYFQASLSIEPFDRPKALQKAWYLKNRVTERERLQIQAQYALRIEHDLSKAIRILEELLQKYPHEQSAYGDLAGYYFLLHNFYKTEQICLAGLKSDSLDKNLLNVLACLYAGLNRRKEALETIDRYMKLVPGEPSPYDSKGDIYFTFGEINSSIFWYQKAVDLRADFWSAEKLGAIAVLRQDYPTGEKYFKQLGSSPSKFNKFLADLALSYTPLHRGQLKQALKGMQDKLSLYLNFNVPWIGSPVDWYLTILANEAHDWPSMLVYAKKASAEAHKNPIDQLYHRELLAWAYLKNGNPDTAYRIMDELKKGLERMSTDNRSRYDYTQGLFAYEEGKYEAAQQHFKKVLESLLPNRAPDYHYAVSLLKAGHLSEAITELERLTWWSMLTPVGLVGLPFLHTMVPWPIASVKAHYWLGVAYEQKGEKDKAIKEYETFLEIWKNADPGIAEVEDAKQRLAKLKKRV